MTFTFFSMFFGAGNLIFPPFVGAQAGAMTPMAAAGFIISAVGLPILGVVAVSLAGGFEQLAGRVSPKFASLLGLAIILTIGPCFAIPRTATTSFEMAIVPFTGSMPQTLSWLPQLLYSATFFAVSFILSAHPERLSKTLGRFMGPLLLALIAVLFVACVVRHSSGFAAPMGDYVSGQVSRGFLDGYQTMDLLAALYFGIVISANVRSRGIGDESQVRRETALAGVGTGMLLIIIYGVLAYMGAASGSIAAIDPAHDTGATVLTNLTAALFGPFGTAFVGLVFVIACLNVCTGLISTCGTYFMNRFPVVAGHRMKYRTWGAIFAVFSFVVSNAGLSMIIKVSVPVLSALYPMAIVLVALTLTHHVFADRFPRVYFWTVLLVGAVAALGCIASLVAVFGGALPWLDATLGLLPLYDAQLGWLTPAAVGVVIGMVDSVMRRR
ncbi:branched-chain amino acid transport system II carrier protein [Bifidobacterium primatium]|uniref:Branched-chain amino acid transport system II carrier protein n=3 Tax=Bifidobacterium TaxID=1678 RepID=A0A2M9H8Q1_9BIFI|nr:MULTISPECIES: branched-chain amino acid transport system II carrier protein [Bifidobacterium]NEG96094.1 branched-chain amino acid transport system II carrier protein [Bifidobacterium sp. SMB2]NEH10828.1 branched-chain amino acid transport system II carrier protein [Bifidobacterium saimiriisciurei]PJM73195.1 branched-chain amino acid transport system II carrier protein [Bifidobacterium primatium]